MSAWIFKFVKIIGFALIIAVWSWLNRSRFAPTTSLVITNVGALALFPIAWFGRRMLDAKPTPDHAARVTTFVHYAVVPLLGAAIFEAIKVGRDWAGWMIPLPRELGWMLMVVTGAILLLTVANLALAGLGAPFAVELSKRLAVNWMYAWTRNPMVLSTLAFFTAVGLWLQSALFLVWMFALVAPPWLYLVKVFEERELELRFGASYVEYKAKTPMLWPRKPRHPHIPAKTEGGKR
jgi:protein-S-isoprenylcysteine O-methyltransferase Ste14